MKISIFFFIILVVFYGCKDEGVSSDQTDTLNQQISEIYNQCSGTKFYPADTYYIASGLTTKVFNEWKNQFKTQYSLSDSIFNSRIKLSSIELSQGPLYVFLRIDYVFVVDWVRSRQAVSIKLGTFPLTQDPSDSAITRAVKLEIRKTDQINLNGVISFAAAKNAICSCSGTMEPEWCNIRFENVTGKLLLWGHCTIDYNANRCKSSAIDLSNGNVVYCTEEPCWIN